MAKELEPTTTERPATREPVRIEIYAAIDGVMGDHPLGFSDLVDPTTTGPEVADLLRRIADEF